MDAWTTALSLPAWGCLWGGGGKRKGRAVGCGAEERFSSGCIEKI